MKLFFDCETNGLTIKPVRIISIAWIIGDSNKISLKKYHVVKPDGFKIEPSAIKIHGISTEWASSVGSSIRKVLKELIKDVTKKKPDSIIAHNINFDLPILLYELEQAKIKHNIGSLNKLCTMRGSRWSRLHKLVHLKS